jgi:hypothetical protein
MTKTIIAGSRNVTDPHEEPREISLQEVCWICSELDYYHKMYPISEVVSGCADGVDHIGICWAKVNKIPIKRFPVTKADWNKHGKSAGHIRNRAMGDYADRLVAFWDYRTPGTNGMINYMEKLNKPRTIYSLSWHSIYED